MGQGTSWQLVLRSRLLAVAAYDPAIRAKSGCGQNLPAGGHGSPAGRKRIPAGGGDPFSHRGRKDPRQPWGVMSGPSTGRDGTRDWDGTEVADRLRAKPAGSSEATAAVGQVDPPGHSKSGPAVT